MTIQPKHVLLWRDSTIADAASATLTLDVPVIGAVTAA